MFCKTVFLHIAAAVLQYSLDGHVSASHELDATSDKFTTKSSLGAVLFGDQMEKNVMGVACSMYGGGGKCLKAFRCET
jgi:hypothetical protein